MVKKCSFKGVEGGGRKMGGVGGRREKVGREAINLIRSSIIAVSKESGSLFTYEREFF